MYIIVFLGVHCVSCWVVQHRFGSHFEFLGLDRTCFSQPTTLPMAAAPPERPLPVRWLRRRVDPWPVGGGVVGGTVVDPDPPTPPPPPPPPPSIPALLILQTLLG